MKSIRMHTSAKIDRHR